MQGPEIGTSGGRKRNKTKSLFLGSLRQIGQEEHEHPYLQERWAWYRGIALGRARPFREGPLDGFSGWDLAVRVLREKRQGQNTKFQAWKTDVSERGKARERSRCGCMEFLYLIDLVLKWLTRLESRYNKLGLELRDWDKTAMYSWPAKGAFSCL